MQGKKGKGMINTIIIITIIAVVLVPVVVCAFAAGLYAIGAAWVHIYGMGRSDEERCGKDLSKTAKRSSKRNCRKQTKASVHSQAHMKDMQ